MYKKPKRLLEEENKFLNKEVERLISLNVI